MNAIPQTCSHPIRHRSNPLAEKNTRRAVILTAIMMVVEILGGWYYHSMALLADGWHMSSHVVALGLALGAYVLARRYAEDGRFSFGTWKLEVLGGYTSGLLLLLVAATMMYQSVVRFFEPLSIQYNEAISIAAVGLLVNMVCAWWLSKSDDHSHAHHDTTQRHNNDPLHPQSNQHSHNDLNLRAAYIHVVTDALTSVLAIIALVAGKWWGADWMDPMMGVVGSVLVALWSINLLRDTGRALLDAEMDMPLVDDIRQVITEADPDAEIDDLHVWRVGQNQYACMLSLKSERYTNAVFYKEQLAQKRELVHVSVELSAPSMEGREQQFPVS